MEFSGTWKEIWTQKGMVEGTKDDIRSYDGWEKSQTDIVEIANRIIDIMDIKTSDRVLEVGCGAGGIAQYCDCIYTGIDFSEPLVEKCRAFFGKNAIYAEANSLPFEDKSFDKCFSWGVFLYFPNMEYMYQVVDEMKRVTKSCIFIGECPCVSHDNKHMLYKKEIFTDLGFEVMDGWSEPYGSDRFNCFYRGE